MPAVSLQHITKSYDGQVVLSDISLDLHPGEKVGLVGANGSGKTTLLRLIIGLETPDSGEITTSRGLSVGYLPQRPDLPEDAKLIDAVSSALAEHHAREGELRALSERIAAAHGTAEEPALLEKYDRLNAQFEAAGAYDYEIRLREVLGGLGFHPNEYGQRVGVLSGGQKCRAALGRMLLRADDLLLLDEPTNHLDIDATRWLEKYLANYSGGAVIISHDRYLLDRVVSKIIEVENHRVSVYPTNYSDFAEAKRIRQLHAEREYEKQNAWLAHQRDYIDRARYRKDSAKQARGRQKYLDRMAEDGHILEKPAAQQDNIKLKFETRERGGEMVIRCERAAKGFGDIQLIRDLDFEMTRGEKVGIVGPNGVGKTTLLRMLLGRLEPDAGTVRLYENLSVGYYDQEHRDLEESQTIIESARSVRPEASEAQARSYLALFLFRGDDVYKRVGDLSGGERSRVLLARLVWLQPQVLVLDEPTNHLDIPAREALERALTMYPGSILMVSHDRFFLDQVAERLLVLPARGRHEHVAGSWSAYAALLAEREETARAETARKQAADRKTGKQHDVGQPRKTRSKYAVQRLEELEAKIIAHERRIEELETTFADPEQMKDAARARQLHEEYNALKQALETLNAQWEQQADALAE